MVGGKKMKKEVKEYIRLSMIRTILLYVVAIILFCMISFVWIDGYFRIIFTVINLIIVIHFFYTIKNYLYYKKNNNILDYKNADKEIIKPILIREKNYILTDNYIINLKNGHLFKYNDITSIYKKKCFGGVTFFGSHALHLTFNEYLYITTKNSNTDRYFIRQIIPITVNGKYYDISEIIKTKNPVVKDI